MMLVVVKKCVVYVLFSAELLGKLYVIILKCKGIMHGVMLR